MEKFGQGKYRIWKLILTLLYTYLFDLPPDLLESPKLIPAFPPAPQLNRRAGRRVPEIG